MDIQWSSLTHQSQLAIKEISEGNDMACQVKMTDLVSVIDFLLDMLNWKIHDKKTGRSDIGRTTGNTIEKYDFNKCDAANFEIKGETRMLSDYNSKAELIDGDENSDPPLKCSGPNEDASEHKNETEKEDFANVATDPDIVINDAPDRKNYNYRRHKKSTTSKESKLPCPFCEYKCDRPVDMRKHVATHTGEKPLKCKYCNYRCIDKGNLRKHEHRKHTRDLPFKCSHCDKKSGTLKRFQIHERTHAIHKCSFCEFKCKLAANLRTHERRIHKGEKDFTCSYCGYKSFCSAELKRHEMTHTGEKPYLCSYCDYKCRDMSSLKNMRSFTLS